MFFILDEVFSQQWLRHKTFSNPTMIFVRILAHLRNFEHVSFYDKKCLVFSLTNVETKGNVLKRNTSHNINFAKFVQNNTHILFIK